MSVTINVALVRGIDYGTEDDGDATAWARREKIDELRGDGVEEDLPQGTGGESRLVIYAEASRVHVFDDWSERPSVPAVAVDDGREAEHDATLRAFCEKHGLPWREPRWLVTVDMG